MIKRLFFFIFLLLQIGIVKSELFSSLSSVEKYSATLPENPPINNNDWLNPDYSQFNRKQRASFLTHFLEVFHIISPVWSIDATQKLLDKITKQRIDQGFRDRFVLTFYPPENTRFIIWGDLHGAFHSLQRTLGELKQREIIDDNLRIINEHYYFIFLGNVIDFSPYSLETLTLVLRLLERNPDRVFYLKGEHENKQMWRGYSLRQELISKTRLYEDLLEQFEKKLDSFFDTLPLAIYLLDKKNDQAVRISYFDPTSTEVNEKNILSFSKSYDQTFVSYPLKEKTGNDKPFSVKAYIQGAGSTLIYLPIPGLFLKESMGNVPIYTLFSSPIQSFQELQSFYYDAFAELTVGKNFQDWKITLYNQDIRKKDGFKKVVEYNLSQAIEYRNQKISDQKNKQLQFGCTVDLKKGLRIQGNRLERTLRACFKEQQAQGGINNKLPELFVLEDDFNPLKARQNALRFLNEYGIDKLICPQGASTLNAYVDLIKEKKLLVLFPISGANALRTSDLSHLIFYRPSASSEGKALTSYILKNYHPTRIAFFYQDDSYGKDILEGAKKVLQEAGIKEWDELAYSRNELDFEKQIKKIKETNPDAIGFFSTSIAAQGLILQLGVSSLSGKTLFGSSDLGIDVYKWFIKDKGLSFITSNPVPDARYSDLEIAKEYRTFANRYNLAVGPMPLETYIASSILFETLKKIKGDITKETIIAEMEKIKNWNFKGIDLDFNSKTREISHTIWLDVGEGQPWLPVKV